MTFKFNENDLAAKGFIVNRSEGINITSDIEFDIFKSSGGAEQRTNARFNRRKITIKGGIKSSNIRQTCDELAAILDMKNLTDRKLEIPNDTKYYMGYCQSNNLGREYKRFTEDAILVFNCDPYRYGNEVTEDDIDGAELTNAGTESCAGIISFTLAEETDLTVSLSDTTGQIVLDDALAGAYEIDLDARTVKKDGVLFTPNFELTRFETFVIEPGSYTINFDPAITANYYYTERYL